MRGRGWRGELGGEVDPCTGQPVQVTPRSTGLRVRLPRRFEQTTVSQAHQDRVHRPGLDAQLLTQLVSVSPRSTVPGEAGEQRNGLRRRAAGPDHAQSLYSKSYFVQCLVGPV